ncbi:hypothetical protein WJR50_33010 [Catalinimonas sp. 4WD22]|uniref:hypothetical protein n=1 Tax=Catalinimonas locisalis TaxID=3133978 RepID=UPI003100F4E4
MADQEEKILIQVELDQQKANKEAQRLEAEIQQLRNRQRELNKAVKDGSISQEQYARDILAVKNEIKQKSAEQRQAIKVSQAEAGSINALRARLAELTKQRNAVNQSTEEGVREASRLDAQMKQLSQRIKQNEEAGDDYRRSVGNYTNSIKDAIGQHRIYGVSLGDLADGHHAVSAGIGGNVTKLKAFKVALASTGIGLVLVALGSLVTYFQSSQRGADKLNQFLSYLGAGMDVIRDRAIQVGEGLYQFFSGNFQQAAETLRASISGVGDEIITEGKAALQIERERQQLARDRINQKYREAQLELQIAKLQSDGENTERSLLARERDLTLALEKQAELTRLKVGLLEREEDLLRRQQALGENLIADDEALQEARVASLQAQTQAEEKLRTISNQRNTVRAQIDKQTTDEINEYRLNREIITLEKLQSLKQESLGDPASSPEVRNAEQVANLRIQAAQKEKAAKDALRSAELQSEITAGATKTEAAQNVAGQIVGITNEQTAIGKAANIAQATASTYAAANKALAAFPPPFSFISAAATVGQGLLNVGKIVKLNKGGWVRGPGTATSDSVPLMGSDGEVMINANSAKIFKHELSAINVAGGGVPLVRSSTPKTHYATGGVIQANRSANANVEQTQILHYLKNQKPPVVSFQEFVKHQDRYNNKINITSI